MKIASMKFRWAAIALAGTLLPGVPTAPTAAPLLAQPPAPARPSLNGIWFLADRNIEREGATTGAPGRADSIAPLFTILPELKGIYLAAYNRRLADKAAGKPLPDPTAQCLPGGMPMFLVAPYAFEILQTDAQINWFQEFLQQTRRIYLDGRRMPEDFDPSFFGFSTGRWDGDTLVVETAGLREDTLLPDGRTHGPNMRITERMRLVATDRMEVKVSVEDPDAFVKPWEITIFFNRHPDGEIIEFFCEHNREVFDPEKGEQTIIKLPTD